MWNDLKSMNSVITIVSHIVHILLPTTLDLEGGQGPWPNLTKHFILPFLMALEDTARYTGFLLAPVESFGLQPRLFLGLEANKNKPFIMWLPIFGAQ